MFPHKKLDWHISRLEKHLQESADDPETRYELSRALLSRGLYHGGGEPWCNRALTLARKVLADDPQHAGALVVAGSALVGMGRPDTARKYLDDALRIEPERADLHLALGALYRSEGDRHLAVKHLEAACRIAPESWETHLYLGRTLAERARELENNQRLVERSQYHLVRALQLGPTPDLEPPLLRDIGLACLETGRYREAEKFFVRLRENERYTAVARYNLGMVAYHLGKYKNAVHCFRQYLDERPDDARVHARMAMAYLQLGEHQRARESCNQALLIDPGNRLASYTLGCSLLEEGSPNEAIRVFKEALAEHPDHREVYLELARLRRSVSDLDWLRQALHAEVSHFDRLPPDPGERSPRHVTRDRIGILLDQLHQCGSQALPIVTDAMGLVQDEGVRFRLFEAACSMTAASLADEVGRALAEPGRAYSVALGTRAIAAASALPEPVLTRGLSVSEEDLKRAAVDRHGAAHDLAHHRENIERERDEARAYQALLLLAIASRRSRTGRKLLERWAATADADLAVAAGAGLAMYGDPKALQSLSERGASARVQRLLAAVVPARASALPRPASDQNDVHCSCCGRTAIDAAHLMAGTEAVICDVCVIHVGRHRATLLAPDEAICSFCGKTHLESRGVYRYQGVDICSHCLELSLGLMEREEVDRFLAAW